MSLSASIKHHTPGRLRLQFSESDFAGGELREAIQALRRSPTLRKVQGNHLTHTLLLEADNEANLQSALQAVAKAEFIHLQTPKTEEEPVPLAELLSKFGGNCDRFIKENSGGRLDLRTGLIMGLSGLGISQMVSGKFLPAGMTLLMYAMGMANPKGASSSNP